MKFISLVIAISSLVASSSAFAGDLSDLSDMTFSCPRAGLNAAAREAANAPTQGRYQFTFFKLITNAASATYEVGFESNYDDEPALNYTVTVYCQQGFDPEKTVKVVRH